MGDQTKRVWRAGPMTLVLVSAFALAAGVVIPILAYLIYRNDSTLWLPALFVMLTVLALLYAWRFGLHPRLEVTDQNVEIIVNASDKNRLRGRVASIAPVMGRRQILTSDPADKSDRDVMEVVVDLEGKPDDLPIGLRVSVIFLE